MTRAARQLREARRCLRYISEGAECENADFDGRDCADSDTPCAPCAARRGLKRIDALRRARGGRGRTA